MSFDSSLTTSNMGAPGVSARKRARTFEPTFDGTAGDDEGHSKGGHSLRKRTRIDYTLEQIDDDLTASVAKSDSASKSAGTPARNRKKRQAQEGLDDDVEEFHSAPASQKRRRTEKSPQPTRGGLARRRSQPKKSLSTPEISTYHIDQPSDNEVQDTILVGLPGGSQLSDDEVTTDSDSLSEPDTHPASSDGTDEGLAQPDQEPATPQPSAILQVEQAVSLASESAEAIEKDLITDSATEKAEITPDNLPLPITVKDPEAANPSDKAEQIDQQVVLAEEAKSPTQEQHEVALTLNNTIEFVKVEAEPGIPQVQSPEPLESPPATEVKSTAGDSIEKQSSQPSSKDLEQPAASSPAIQVKPIAPAKHSDSTTSVRPPLRTQSSAPPTRLKVLEHIYQTPTPFGTEIRLTPYEKEEVLHPGLSTEWADNKDKVEVTPMPTPAPTPSPIESGPAEFAWDFSHPLKYGEFYRLYEQEKRKAGPGPFPSMMAYYKECIEKYKSHKKEARAESVGDSGTETPSQSQTLITGLYAKKQDLWKAVRRLQPEPAVSSPAPIEEEDVQMDANADAGDDEQEADDVENTKGARTGAGEPVEVVRNPPKRWAFPKLRDPQEFVDALEGWQEMEQSNLYSTVAAAVEAMHAYQMEYNELKKIVDDEENAKRRVANDKTIVNWENRQKTDEPAPWRRHFDDAVRGPPAFEVRGARAPKPYVDDPMLEHQREEDKIMAQAYGFKHNAHPTQVGRQNPEDQRWEMTENRLRERKKTEKGAELAEENVIEGKRMRKPRNFSDQSKEPSRSGTPILPSSLGTGRRGARRKPFTSMNGDDAEVSEAAPTTEPAPEFLNRRRRGGFRGRAEIPAEQDDPNPSSQLDNNQSEDEAVEEIHGSARKRGKALPILQPPIVTPVESEDTRPKRQRNTKPEIPSSSFYSNQSVDSQLESRPSTASSAATVATEETAESSYSLRDKRKRNFAVENDPELETRPTKRVTRGVVLPKFEGLEPKKKTTQKSKSTAATSQPAQQHLAPAPVSAPIVAPIAEPSPVAPSPSPASMPAMVPVVPISPVAAAPPTPVGGLKAPTLIFSNPPPTLAPAPPGPFLHTFNAAPAFPPGGKPPPPAAPPSVKKPITKIKLTNNGGLSRAGTPANIAPNPNPRGTATGTGTGTSTGTGKGSRGGKVGGLAKPAGLNGANPLDEKPYHEMSKSEKMSYSMRRKFTDHMFG